MRALRLERAARAARGVRGSAPFGRASGSCRGAALRGAGPGRSARSRGPAGHGGELIEGDLLERLGLGAGEAELVGRALEVAEGPWIAAGQRAEDHQRLEVV